MMNGEGGPNVPITTLAGIQSITELLLELPLPTALSGTQRSLLAPQQIEESRRILNAPLDTRLLPLLVEALGHTPGVEQLELEDDVTGTPPPQACSQLLQHLLARGIFKGPSPWQNTPSALPNLGTEGVQFDANFYPNVQQPATPHFAAPLGDAGFLDGGQFSPKFQQQAPGVTPMAPASFYSNGNCVSRDKRTESAVLGGQTVLSPPATVHCEPPAGGSGQNAVAPKTPMEPVQTTPPPAPPAKEPRRNQVVNNIDVESKRPQRAMASSHVPEPTRKSPQKVAPKADPKRGRNSARENNRIVSSSDEEEVHPVKKRKKLREGDHHHRSGKVEQKKNCSRTPLKSDRSSMDIYASSLSERVKNRRRTSQKAKYAESPTRSASDGEHSAFEPDEEVRPPPPPRERIPKPVKPKKVKKEPAPAPLSSEEMMESNTYQRFTRTVEAIFDAMEEVDLTQELDDEADCPSEALLSATLLRDLCNEAAKLKVLQGTSQVPQERINKLMAILERNIVDGSRLCPIENPHEDPDDEEGRVWLDLVMERINRSTDASLTVLYITTSPNMTTKLFLEDILERVVGFAKFQIQNTVYPVFDPVYRTDSKSKDGCVTSIKQKRAHATHRVREKWVLSLYNKLHELVGLLAEVLENQRLTDTLVLQISALGVGPFFVEGVSELQLHALRLVTTIFAQYEKHRQLILEDILASIARLPTSKRSLRNYRLNSEEHIQMLTALVLQLIHSVVKLPDPRPPDPGGGSNDKIDEANKEKEEKCAVDADVLIVTSYEAAVRTAVNFLSVFLKKCGTKNEDMDYRPVFENFVQDLLSTVNKPEWPAGELVLSLLGRLLVQNFSNKSLDMSLRVSSLDYLGVVAARLRKDAVTSQIKKETIDDILRQIEEDEEDDMPLTSLSRSKKHSKKASTSTSRDEIQLLQRALLHYLDANLESDPSLQFTRKFYIAQWYRDALAEAKADRNNKDNKDDEQSKAKTNNRQVRNARKNCEKVVEEESEEEEEETEEKEKKESKDDVMQKALALAEERKRFLLQAAHPDTCGRGLRAETLDQSTAELISRFLASRRPFSQSFDVYLSQILRVLSESAVAVRTKAMKCLTLVVEADPSILGRPDMCHGVHGRLLDHSTSVREAAVDLVGKFILVRPELTHKYYDMLTERILDTGVSVRKRVIKILKDVCLEQPDFEKIPEICVKVIRRVNDEDGIRKLVGEVFQSMWFTPQPNEERMLQKVQHITHVVAACREMGLEWLEQLLNNLLKNKEDSHYKSVLQSCRQIVDCLVEHVLELEEGASAGGASQHLVACLTTLYLFSKIRPQLLVRHAATIQPYLSMRLVGPTDLQVLQNATRCLELVVPLMEHPSESFLEQVEESLAKQLLRHGLAHLPTTVSCLGAVVNRVTRNYQLVRDFFHKFLLLLTFLKQNHETGQPCEKPKLQRCLYTLGLLCRHFDIQHLEAEDGNTSSASHDGQPLRDRVFEAVIYFTRHEDEDMRIKALTGLGFLLVRHHDLMLGPEVKELYRYLLGNLGCPAVERCQVLKNLTAYLLEEEARMIQKDAEWSKVSKEENLKEMGDVSSGMASTVVQVYLRDILMSVTSCELIVRRAALHVIQLIMGQGLVHPVQMVPHLVCLESDDDQRLRTKADQLLQDLEKKYPGFVQMKAIAGVRMAFQVHREIQRSGCVVRGYREPAQGSNDAPASRHGFLYTVLRATRQSRRAFLLALLKLFDEHARTPLSELLYVADNIVYFPYQVQDEPLFVMHYIDVILSVSGSNLLQSFREALLPRHNGAPQPEEDDDDDDDVTSLCARLPEDRTVLRDCMVAAQACMLLLFVKQTLKDTYGFTDGRIQQYSPTESAKTYEKALNRKSGVRFKPTPALEALETDEDAMPSGEELVQRYVDFKQLMLTIDPDEGDDDDNPRPPPPPGIPLPQSSTAEGGGDDTMKTPKQKPPPTPSSSSRSRVGRPPKSAKALVPVKKKPRKKRKRVVCSDESSDNEDSDPSFGGD